MCSSDLLTRGEVLFLGIQGGLMLVPGGLGRGSQVRRLFLGLLDVGHLHGELHIALGQFLLKGPLLLASLVEPGLRLGNTRLEVHLRVVHRCHPGLGLVQAGVMERLELPKAGAHGLEKPLLLRTVATGARLVNNLEPGGGKHLAVKDFSFGGRSA